MQPSYRFNREPTETEETLKSFEISQQPFNDYYDVDPGLVYWRPPYYVHARGWKLDTEDCPGLECDPCFYGPHPPAALLAHEMIHAWHDQLGKYCEDSDATAPEEICTAQSENQIRVEMGKRIRCSYDGVCLNFPDPDDTRTWQLDAPDCIGGVYECTLLNIHEDRGGCGCKPTWWPAVAYRDSDGYLLVERGGS